MRIRAKFTKKGHVKFVGHLDTVRLFQRALRVANMPLAYSEGFNPHPKTYFALPLSVGVSSKGEYLEFITTCDVDLKQAQAQINQVLPEGITLLDIYEVPEGVKRLMTLVAMADYIITVQKDSVPATFVEDFNALVKEDQIMILKKNKKKQIKEVDIKPLIIATQVNIVDETYVVTLKALAGSEKNLKADALLQALLKDGFEKAQYDIERKEMYAKDGQAFVPIAEYDRV